MRFQVLVLATLGFQAPLAAQTATVRGLAVRADTGTPVAGVLVRFDQLGRDVTSDLAGRFSLDSLPLGVHTGAVRAIGYRPVTLRLYLGIPGVADVRLELEPSVVELEPIEVRASTVPPGMEAFAERRLTTTGYFIDATTLRREEHRALSDLLRGIPGVLIRADGEAIGSGEKFLLSRRDRCPMQIYIDGAVFYRPAAGAIDGVRPLGRRNSPTTNPAPSIDEFGVAQIEAIEVYSGPATTPAQLAGTGGGCGTIVIWTRRR